MWVLCGASAACAQPGFLRTYDLPPGSTVHGADATPDGGLVLCGTMADSAFLMRVDVAGQLLWSRTFTAEGANDLGTYWTPYEQLDFQDVTAVNDTACLVAGAGTVPGFLGGQSIVASFHSSGDTSWARVIDWSIYSDLLTAAVMENSTTALVAGRLGGLNSDWSKVYRIDLGTGTVTGSNGFSGAPYSWAQRMDRGADGSILLTSPGDAMFSLIGRFDAGLNALWANEYIGLQTRTVKGLPDGSVLAAGDSVLLKLTPAGTVDWAKSILVGNGAITDMAVRPDGHVLLLGWTTDVDTYSWIVHVDAAGAPVWGRRFGGVGDDVRLTELDLLPDGSLRLNGMSGSNALVVGTDSLGVIGTCPFPNLTYSVNTASVSLGLVWPTQSTPNDPPQHLRALGTTLYVPNGYDCADLTADRATGTVFNDQDLDGVLDAGEPLVPYSPVAITPGNVLAFSSGSGTYTFLPGTAGTYDLDAVLPNAWWQLTAGGNGHTVTFTATDTLFEDLDFGLAALVDTTLVEGSLVHGLAPCGGVIDLIASATNAGTSTPQGVLALTIDPAYTYLGASPPVDSIVGQTYYWSFDTLQWSMNTQRILTVIRPSVGQLGDTLVNVVGIWTDDGLGNLSLNDTTAFVEVHTCAYDPNDKLVDPVGEGPKHATPFDVEWLTYTVRFQNTGTDTAYTVVIEDLLSPHLQHETLQVLATSHTLTDLTIGSGGMAEFRFENILLPDSNVNALGSQGFVTFRIRPGPGLPHTTPIENNAAIFFDLNPPVITNTVLNTLVNCAQSDLTSFIFDPGDGTLWGPFVQDEPYTYQWWLNGSPIPGATEMFLETTMNGQYVLELTDQYGCTAFSTPVTVIITALTERPEPRIAVFPNPMTHGANLVCTEPLTNGDQVRLLDLNGRTLRLLYGHGSRTVYLDRGELPSGMYAVQVIRASGPVSSFRIVVD